ncbi:MAG TPA: type II secretion system protein [Candidatus Saccharimonadales bacterium]|nr:type II secretion system protein [Candidatus Saccharimonadales bacterium]
MNVQQKNKEKGFTIIEVVLVLAIAGLIFLMVFIALPALQRSQRDTQRKQDLSRALTKVNDYQSNNRNALPAENNAAWNSFATTYLRAGGDSFADPSRGDYTFNVTTADPTFGTDTAVITVATNKTCNGEGLSDAGTRKVALRIKLEGGGIACENN